MGHILRKEPNNHQRIALRWTPEGKRKRGRPKETWRCTVEREMKMLKTSVLGAGSWCGQEQR